MTSYSLRITRQNDTIFDAHASAAQEAQGQEAGGARRGCITGGVRSAAQARTAALGCGRPA